MHLYIWPFTFSLSLLKEMSSNWLRNTADISLVLTQKSECKTLRAVVMMIHNMNCIYDLFWGSLTWKEAFLETIKLFWNDEMVYFWIIQSLFSWDFGLTSGRLNWSIKFNPPSLSKPPFGLFLNLPSTG